MTDRELQMQFLMLEDSYRKLEEKVAKLEVEIGLKRMLGVQEQLKNTSISLFLLRKDRERLSKGLGLDISEYKSAKSIGEEALEELIYNCKDVLAELTRETESVFSPVILDIDGKEDKVEKPKRRVTRKARKEDSLNEGNKVIEHLDLEEVVADHTDKVKEPIQSQAAQEVITSKGTEQGAEQGIIQGATQVIEKEEEVVHKTVSNSNIEHLNNENVAVDSFEDMDAVLGMWA